MKLLSVLAATAAAAAVAAAITIPASANPRTGGPAAKKLGAAGPAAPAELVSCLRAHGLNPPGNPLQLKPWMIRQDGTTAGKAALRACHVAFDSTQAAGTGKDLAACLHSHGADVPSGADGLALKTWIRDHSRDLSVADALERCGAGMAKATVTPGGCGGSAAAAARKQDASTEPAR